MSWTEDKDWSRWDWKQDVACGDTQLGYWDWVKHNRECAEDHCSPTETPNECQNCGKTWDDSELNTIEDVHQRVAPGEPMPSGACPECGAVCHPVQS